MNLKEYRRKNNLTQLELAEQLKVHNSLICKWEFGIYSKKLHKALERDKIDIDIPESESDFLRRQIRQLKKENQELAAKLKNATSGRYNKNMQMMETYMKRTLQRFNNSCEDLLNKHSEVK